MWTPTCEIYFEISYIYLINHLSLKEIMHYYFNEKKIMNSPLVFKSITYSSDTKERKISITRRVYLSYITNVVYYKLIKNNFKY